MPGPHHYSGTKHNTLQLWKNSPTFGTELPIRTIYFNPIVDFI
ncbi:hypothetical protein MARINOS108_10401 [Marinoscillum sp. 108]|nr:hypothetical protein MARINOS108_10401 [Marinoscillum sp. 108]